MLRITIKLAHKSFFSTEAVTRAIGRAEAAVLSRQGAYVRRVAQRSMRKRPGRSRPGEPPHVHTGLLKKFLYFVYSRAEHTVIVGPAAFSERSNAPAALERGGTSRTRVTDRRGSLTITIEIEARPYMGPALVRAKPHFPGFWRDTIGNGAR